jgi:hypothetical protein
MPLAWPIFVAAAICSASPHDVPVADPARQTLAEDDWWLPDWVKPLPEVVGFYGPNPPDVPDQKLKLVTFTWRDVNPREDVYDWSMLEKTLKSDHGIYLRLENSHVIHCPKWLEEKYPELHHKIIQGDPVGDNFDRQTGGTYYPIWHPGFSAEFRKLLANFKAKGFGNHKRFRFWYIPGAWAWGEFGVEHVKQMERDGLKPEGFLRWWRRTVDAYVEAVGPKNAHKLMYTDHDYLSLCDGNATWQKAIGREPFAYVIRRGGSTRFGLLEKFDFMVGDLPNYGLPAVEIGGARYQIANEDAPLLADPHRWIGAENEEAGNANIPWDNYYQLKMTALRSLQLRVNCVFMGRGIWAKAPELHHYMLTTLGRRPADSPDAWCALREWRDVYQEWSRWNFGFRGQWRAQNWERWLWQREVGPNGNTVADCRVKTPVKFNEDKFEARRTDHVHGSDYIYFGVEDRFLHGGSNRVQVKVTYMDDFSGKWWLEYDSAGEEVYKRSRPQTNDNDGKWKTVTFELFDAGFRNRQKQGMDFRLYNGGRHDLTVRFVRVVRLDRPDQKR